MLERYFVKPATIDRFQGSWIASEIESYLSWLVENGYGARTILRRIPIEFAFGEFVWGRGGRVVADLPDHVEAFVADRVARHAERAWSGRSIAKEVRGPVEQMLTVALPGFEGAGRQHSSAPFADALPGFFEHLSGERGLRASSLFQYRHHLSRFEAYLSRTGVTGLSGLSPTVLSAFMVERSARGLSKGLRGINLVGFGRVGVGVCQVNGVTVWFHFIWFWRIGGRRR